MASAKPEQNGENEPSDLVETLLSSCKNLLKELEEFRAFMAEEKESRCLAPSSAGSDLVAIRQFYSCVTSELKSLERLSTGDQGTEKTIHTLKSSNLPFFVAIWEAAKASRGLVTLHKRFYWDHNRTRTSKKESEKRFALVDVVSQDGDEWIKVSTVTEHRLIFELSKAQWEAGDSSDSESDEANRREGARAEGSVLDRMELIQSIDGLVRASRAHRIHYQSPKVRVILSKISDPPPSQLLPLLDRIRSAGASLNLGPPDESPTDIKDLRSKVFPALLPSPHPSLTKTLNVDCTILLALVSDLSHSANHPILPSYNGAIRRQIELETRDHLLPSGLWPAMADKTLVCTQEAVRRMREIVDTIGTPNECARTNILFGERESTEQEEAGKDLHAEFSKLSDYPVPPSLRFPITVVPTISASELNTAIEAKAIPSIATRISEELTDINRSVFMYGWVKGFTTVSSNRAVSRWIENTVQASDSNAIGPEIWLREPARSLLGKEKERRK